jgi:hypothetical protein
VRVQAGSSAVLFFLVVPAYLLGVVLVEPGAAQCTVSPAEIDFGTVDIGDTVSALVTVTNNSDATIKTTVKVNQPYSGYWGNEPDYSGGGTLTLSPGQSGTRTIRFHPRKEGTRQCTVTGCGTIPCVGVGYRVCYDARSSMGFGEVVIGQSRIQRFAIYGIEGRTISGRARLAGRTSFGIVDGGGDFTIGPGEYHEIIVEFAPFGIGYQEDVIEVGVACKDIEVAGAGRPESLEAPNPDASILFHVRPHEEIYECPGSVTDALGPCSGYTTSGSAGPESSYDAYVVLARGVEERGFAGADFGIDYSGNPGVGVDVTGWIFCGAQEYPTPDWPAAQEGNLVTWNHETDCQQSTVFGHQRLGVHALIGVLRVDAYSMDVLRIIPRPHVISQGPHVSDCAAQVNQVVPSSRWGAAVFTADAEVPGCNPCLDNCGEPVRALCASFPSRVRFDPLPYGGHADTTVYVLNPFLLPLTGEVRLDPGDFSITQGEGLFSIDPGQILRIGVRYNGGEDRSEALLRIEPLCEGVVLIGGEPDPNRDDLTPVAVTGMSVGWDGDAAVVRWRTAEVLRDAVFTVHRQDAPGGERRSLPGTPVRDGTDFTFLDTAAPRSGAGYWLSVTRPRGDADWFGPYALSPRPFSLVLGANRPNPFPAQTALSFEIPVAGRVVLCVYDLSGREVARLVDRSLPAGRFDASWDGRDGQGRSAPAGIYLLRLVTEGGVKSRKLTRIG